MAITEPLSSTPKSYTALDIIAGALIEVGMIAPGEDPEGSVGEWALDKLNDLLDVWAARSNFVYAHTFNVYTLVPNLSPHTIGSDAGATYAVTQRPEKIVAANVILNSANPPTEPSLNLRDAEWWANQPSKSIANDLPTDLFYNPAFPNGELYFWPVPTSAYQVRLECWVLLSQFSSITDNIGGPNGSTTVPPAYRTAMKLSLAESLCPGGGKEADRMLVNQAARARRAIFNNNTKAPRISTKDSGIPSSDARATTFNYRNRSF